MEPKNNNIRTLKDKLDDRHHYLNSLLAILVFNYMQLQLYANRILDQSSNLHGIFALN